MNIVIFISTQDVNQAERIASGLIETKLAACVNIVPSVKSIFWWQRKIDSCQETLLIVKTKKALLNKLIKVVKKLHSYEVPEIIALPIIGGNREYLNWIDESTG